LYRLRRGSAGDAGRVLLGSELIAGVEMAAGDWTLERAGEPPYAKPAK
jgi:hypothetical protein